MTSPTPHRQIPAAAEQDALNAAVLATGADTGFWDDDGRPAPSPDDIEQMATHHPRAGKRRTTLLTRIRG